MKKFLVFRHGETEWNRTRRLQGNTDIPLNETGRVQALRLREYFSKNPVEVMLSSDLSRARETAEIAIGDLDVPIIIDPRLRETYLGEAEGLTHPEILERYGAEAWEAWYAIGPGAGTFRFPGGENKQEHLRRLLDALDSFARSTDSFRIGVATHGGAIRRLIHHLRPELQEPVMIGNCVMYELSFHTSQGLWTVELEPVCGLDSNKNTF